MTPADISPSEQVIGKVRTLSTALVTGVTAAVIGAISVLGHAPFGPVSSSISVWIVEMVLVLSGIAIAVQSFKQPEPGYLPHLITVFGAAFLGLLALYFTGTQHSAEYIALRYALGFAVIFLLLPLDRRAAPWLATGGGIAFTMSLIAAMPALDLATTGIWLAIMVMLCGCVLVPLGVLPRSDSDLAGSARIAEPASMLAVINHEMRTPLNAITGFTSLLALKPAVRDDPELSELVDHIQTAGQRLARLTDDLLDLEQAGHGRLSMEIGRVDLTAIARETVDSFMPMGRENSVRLIGPEGPGGGLHVDADPGRVRQVLGNLMSNAIKFNTAGGTVTVTLRAGQRFGSISVADDGPGIAPENLPRLFTMFDRLDLARHDASGHGIGLALSRALITAMKGRIDVQSVPGSGTVFTVDLPIAVAKVEQPHPEIAVESQA